MIILGIDTSCDDSSVAIVDTDDNSLLADTVFSHVKEMTPYGGIVPEIASRQHLTGLPTALSTALITAQLELRQIDWFVVTNRPGLIGALLVGVSFIKGLAYSLGKPFSVVDHLDAHLYSPLLAELEGNSAPPFPWIALVVSGGHTELYHVRSLLDHEWLGGTLDDAAGEAFDKIGKLTGLTYPAGPQIDKMARDRSPLILRDAVSLPRSLPNEFDFSFSGLKTAVSVFAARHPPKSADEITALLTSAQEAILDPLVERVKKAQKHFGASSIVVSGGVACNSRLREKLKEAYFPPPRHCTDNAAMVAGLGRLYLKQRRLTQSPWNETAYSQSTSQHSP